MKKKVIIVGIVIVIIVVILVLPHDAEKNNITKSSDSGLAIMVENALGKYEKYSGETWPTDRYVYKSSECNNGSVLSWDNSTKTLLFTGNKSDECTVYFDEMFLTDYIQSLYTKDGDNNLYYHDGKGNYTNVELETGDFSYRYSGGKYYLTQKAINANYKDIYDIIKSNCSNSILDHTYWCSSTYNFILTYDSQKSFSNLSDAIKAAIADGYIIEKDINNYVCIGDKGEKCSNNDLYRIIGLFKNSKNEYETKLIKAQYASGDLLGKQGTYSSELYGGNTYIGIAEPAGMYKWSKSESDTWENSDFNKLNLNSQFLTNLGKWQAKISDSNWHVGKISSDDIINTNAKIAYQKEVVNNNETYEAKIGLMYISDYYFAAAPEYHSKIGWTKGVTNNQSKDDYRLSLFSNWLYLGSTEHTLTCNLDNNANYTIDFSGLIGNNISKVGAAPMRPVFYLKSDVKIAGGTGTETNPYLIS